MIISNLRRVWRSHTGQSKVNPVEPSKRTSDAQPSEDTSDTKDERRKKDRRKNPFVHRGPFEMRSGEDRRAKTHVDDEV